MRHKTNISEDTLAANNILYRDVSEETSRYRNLYENSPDMYVSVDPKSSRIKYCNNTMASKTGYSKEEIIGQPIFFMYHPDCMKNVEKAFGSFVKTGHVQNAELELKRKDGKKIDILLNVEAVFDDDGEIIHSNSCCRDIGEIVSLRKELAHHRLNLEKKVKKVKERTHELEVRNKELEQFVYIASHDLQEPLNSIIGFSQLLRSHVEDRHDEFEVMSTNAIEQSANRMKEFIMAVLEYSRIGRKKQKSNIDTSKLVGNIKDDLFDAIDKSNAQINVASLPVIRGYEQDVKMLFQNIIVNAIKYKKEGQDPVINVSCHENDSHFVFSISDNGIGVKPKYQPVIFEIFRRLHTRDKYEGTGIGLAHCKKIADMHDGDVWMDSDGEKGSTFHFSIGKGL